MVRTRINQGWQRRGFTLLWDAEILVNLVAPQDVISIRKFFLQIDNWSDNLPGANGDALVITGFEGCLEILDGNDAKKWIETDLKEAILSFQDFFQGQAGLVIWTPSGRSRLTMKGASEEYFWKHRSIAGDGLPIGRLLFSGAENELERILNTENHKADYDGKYWAGLHHPRIS